MNEVNMADVFVGSAHRLGARTAIVSPTLTLTYEELIGRASRSARELRDRGVEPWSRIGIATRDTAEAAVLMIALWMIGATPVPLDFRTKSADRAALADLFDLTAIVEDRQVRGQSPYASVLADGSWTEVIARHDSSPLFATRPGPAVIELSSGTTGRPIGAVLDHASFLLRLLFPVELAPRNLGGNAVTSIPLSFAMSIHYTFNQFLDGVTMHFIPLLSGPDEICEAIRSTRAVSAGVVPTILNGILELPHGKSGLYLDSLRTLYCSGGPLSAEMKRRARSAVTPHLIETYASILTGRVTLLHGEDMDARPETVGRILPQAVVQIVDDRDTPLPIGETGVIRVRAPGMARYVLAGEERANGDGIRNGWAYPGDLGSVDGDGFLTLAGRTADVINRGGVSVHPLEVERVLQELDGVREAAVVDFFPTPDVAEIAAFVVADGPVDASVLAGHCRVRLVSDKRPRKFVFVPELPRNANGKVVRSQLRDRLARGEWA